MYALVMRPFLNSGVKLLRALISLRQEKDEMRTIHLLVILAILFPSFNRSAPAQQKTSGQPSIYHDGWIDLNKNGKMDVYENPKADINQRIVDLLSQMTL